MLSAKLIATFGSNKSVVWFLLVCCVFILSYYFFCWFGFVVYESLPMDHTNLASTTTKSDKGHMTVQQTEAAAVTENDKWK